MSDKKPTITFHAILRTTVPPDALYAALSDPNTHLTWAGKQAPHKAFRLLTMEAPAGSAAVGMTFSSSGANSKSGSMTFYDTSAVVEADPGRRFGFDTESRLERRRAKTWYCHFEHRYTIEAAGTASTITYDCKVYPKNYHPYWLKPWMRPMTRALVNRTHTKHMENLARLVENARV